MESERDTALWKLDGTRSMCAVQYCTVLFPCSALLDRSSGRHPLLWSAQSPVECHSVPLAESRRNSAFSELFVELALQ